LSWVHRNLQPSVHCGSTEWSGVTSLSWAPSLLASGQQSLKLKWKKKKKAEVSKVTLPLVFIKKNSEVVPKVFLLLPSLSPSPRVDCAFCIYSHPSDQHFETSFPLKSFSLLKNPPFYFGRNELSLGGLWTLSTTSASQLVTLSS
jgi:hypothetical protein